MENPNNDIEKAVKKIVKRVTATTGHQGSEIVKSDCPKNLYQLIQSQVPPQLHLKPRPLPAELKEKLQKLSNQHEEDSRDKYEEPSTSYEMPKTPTPKVTGSSSQEKKPTESFLEVKNPPDTPVFDNKTLESYVRNKKFSKSIPLETLAIGFWQIAEGLLKCQTQCRTLEREIEKDVDLIQLEAERARDYEHENKLLRSSLVKCKDDLEDMKSIAHQLESQNAELVTNMAKLSNTQKDISEEARRTELYNQLSQMHPSLIKEQWVNVDSKTPVGFHAYPIFHVKGVFYNPYKSCATETDVQDVNANLRCSYPYMTIMSMALDSLPDSVKPTFIRELASANTALEFFLSLNAIARMSPIINQCIRALRESRDKESIDRLSHSINTAREQMGYNNSTMVSFMSQTEQHRNVLVEVSKRIQTFLESFPDAAKIILSCKPKAPPIISYILEISGFVFMIFGDSPRTAVIKKDKTCQSPETEQLLVDSMTVHLPAIFHLLTENYIDSARQLIISLIGHMFEIPDLSCKIEKWVPGARK